MASRIHNNEPSHDQNLIAELEDKSFERLYSKISLGKLLKVLKRSNISERVKPLIRATALTLFKLHGPTIAVNFLMRYIGKNDRAALSMPRSYKGPYRYRKNRISIVKPQREEIVINSQDPHWNKEGFSYSGNLAYKAAFLKKLMIGHTEEFNFNSGIDKELFNEFNKLDSEGKKKEYKKLKEELVNLQL